MAADLKPCPFCGGKPVMRDQQVAEDCVETWVECDDCEASTARIEGAYSERPAAAAYWNQRSNAGVCVLDDRVSRTPAPDGKDRP